MTSCLEGKGGGEREFWPDIESSEFSKYTRTRYAMLVPQDYIAVLKTIMNHSTDIAIFKPNTYNYLI